MAVLCDVRVRLLTIALGVLWLTAFATVHAGQLPTTGKGLYEIGCAKCHGMDGRGVDLSTVGFNVPVPDFSDCSFGSREPDQDWLAVSHSGGPTRGFSDSMPAFGEAFNDGQFQKIIDYLREFCPDDSWPRGELNLPRPLVTEKAYPEDEAVWTTTIDAEGGGAIKNEIVYEHRLGPLSQLELKLPFGSQETGADGQRRTGLGDVVLGMKRTLFHSLQRGSIFSINGELILPTGDEFGKGTTVFETFVAFGQILPRDSFLHFQAGVELPFEVTESAEQEAFWRFVLGRTFTQGRWGRSWSPMIEVLGKAELESGKVDWDLLPQVQVSLNKRQHVLANVGVRFPVNDAEARDTQILFYVLWDWFDGGLLDGW